MKTKILTMLMILILIMSCGSGKGVDKKIDLTKINSIIESGIVFIDSDFASPQNAAQIANLNLLPVGNNSGNISLIGNHNYFNIIGDSLSIKLPYYGEHQIGGGYNPDGVGINFDGKAEVFRHTFNTKKNKHEFYIEVKNSTETFQIRVDIRPNLKTEIGVNSNQRTFISYRGNVIEEQP
ncbi:DUF4251 domain-containing protein [Seonamhaeicola sp. MEBiC1930]|uniref:DUF4251 domain-containing protein n=1 Tax=Seonamhaeicola sp. MEBiC01930 TaxID=2976768 RepID=UPI003249ADB0